MFKDKSILIVGGTGSWGKELISQLINFSPKLIRVLSRNEFNSVSVQRQFNNAKLEFVIGDVRDYDAVNAVSVGIDYTFLLSAIKHVPVCESQPDEAIKTNIIGTQNVIRACLANNVVKCIDVSTDKACAPNNLYGLTKAVGEKLVLNSNKYNKTRFICIRAGNVLGSAGSVVPLFIDQIKKRNNITVTDQSMTRYFMTLPEAIRLLLKACTIDFPANLVVMKMPSCTIRDLSEVIARRYGDEITTITIIGSRPGEKKHEMLLSEHESGIAYEYDTNYFVVSDELLPLNKVNFEYYSSNSQILMTKPQISEMLQKGGF